MDKIKSFVMKYENNLKFVYLFCIGIHSLNCYSRSDYNLFLYIILFLMWTPEINIGTVNKEIMNEEKIFSYVLLICTFIFDIIWFMIRGNESQFLYGLNYLMFKLCYFFSILGFIIKILLFIILGILAWDNLKDAKNKFKLSNISSSANRFQE